MRWLKIDCDWWFHVFKNKMIVWFEIRLWVCQVVIYPISPLPTTSPSSSSLSSKEMMIIKINQQINHQPNNYYILWGISQLFYLVIIFYISLFSIILQINLLFNIYIIIILQILYSIQFNLYNESILYNTLPPPSIMIIGWMDFGWITLILDHLLLLPIQFLHLHYLIKYSSLLF